MFEEPTNLYRVVAQTFEWIHGLTSIEFQVAGGRIAEVTQKDKTHYSFEVTSNSARLSGLRHPMGLVIENMHIVMTGVVIDHPEYLRFDKSIAPVELEDMPRILLQADNGGHTTVGVQTHMGLFLGGEEVLTRHFVYRNNFLYMIR